MLFMYDSIPGSGRRPRRCRAERQATFALSLAAVALVLVSLPPAASAMGAPSGGVLSFFQRRASDPRSVTLLNEAARLRRPVMPAERAGWASALHEGRLHGEAAAKLYLWLGEYALGQNQDPERATWYFTKAQGLAGHRTHEYGRATYDKAFCLLDEGAYADATAAFHRLLPGVHPLRGYDPRDCVMVYRHANACWGYHLSHQKIGIPEPPRLDPFCGAASLAVCMRSLGLRWSRPWILSRVKVTGEGSTTQDLLNAGPKLGIHLRAVAADDTGLRALPKPCVADVDANGNQKVFNCASPLQTIFATKDSHGAVIYTHAASFDNYMSAAADTDGAGTMVWSKSYSDPNDPYAPSSVTDAIGAALNPEVAQGSSGSFTSTGGDAPASETWDIVLNHTIVASSAAPNGWTVSLNTTNGVNNFMVSAPAGATVAAGYEVRYGDNYDFYEQTWYSAVFDVVAPGTIPKGTTSFTWDQFGNMLTVTTPRGTVTTDTYSYANFGLGERTQVKVGNKSPPLCQYKMRQSTTISR